VLFLEAEEIFARFVLMAFLNSPCHETPKNAIKKKSNKTTEGGGKKTDGKKSRIFCDEMDFFEKKFFSCF
jgi:hypothetical protein